MVCCPHQAAVPETFTANSKSFAIKCKKISPSRKNRWGTGKDLRSCSHSCPKFLLQKYAKGKIDSSTVVAMVKGLFFCY